MTTADLITKLEEIGWSLGNSQTNLGRLLDQLKQELPETPPVCDVHKVPMVQVKGKSGSFFWSCHQKNADGTWCSYKPKAY